jgi:hypothetical protein
MIGKCSSLETEANEARARMTEPVSPTIDEFMLTPSNLLRDPTSPGGSSLQLLVVLLAHTFEYFTLRRATCNYSEATDPPRYTGPFLPFVKACLEPIDVRSRAELGLGKSVQTALQQWRRTVAAREESLVDEEKQEVRRSD